MVTPAFGYDTCAVTWWCLALGEASGTGQPFESCRPDSKRTDESSSTQDAIYFRILLARIRGQGADARPGAAFFVPFFPPSQSSWRRLGRQASSFRAADSGIRRARTGRWACGE